MRSALQARLLVALQHASGGIHTHDTSNAPALRLPTPHAAGLQAKRPDNTVVTTAKLTAAAILMMVLSKQVTTG